MSADADAGADAVAAAAAEEEKRRAENAKTPVNCQIAALLNNLTALLLLLTADVENTVEGGGRPANINIIKTASRTTEKQQAAITTV